MRCRGGAAYKRRQDRERDAVHCDDAADQIGTLFGYEGIIATVSVCQENLRCTVVGHRIGESRENSVVGVLHTRCRSEANAGDRINLEDRVARVVYGGRGVQCYGSKCLWYGLSS